MDIFKKQILNNEASPKTILGLDENYLDKENDKNVNIINTINIDNENNMENKYSKFSADSQKQLMTYIEPCSKVDLIEDANNKPYIVRRSLNNHKEINYDEYFGISKNDDNMVVVDDPNIVRKYYSGGKIEKNRAYSKNKKK
jgi:hypothetical protein